MVTFHHFEKISRDYCWMQDTRDQLKDYIYRLSDRYFREGDVARDRITTGSDLLKRQEWIHQSFRESVGGIPEVGMPVKSEILGTVQCDGYRIEKLIFESRPGVLVTANLYLPDHFSEPSAAVLFLCGHWTEGRLAAEYQMVCQQLVDAGLIVLAQDPVGQGERLSYYDAATGQTMVSSCIEEHDYAGFQTMLLGQSIARYFVHDAMRGIDYLCSRPEVDNARIGVTGNSGGGTQTSLVMMADSRIAAAAPATFIMNRYAYQVSGQAQDREQIWHGFTAKGLDHEDILLSVAPKPVLVLAVEHDFFPLESTTRTVERCRRVWEMMGKKENLEFFADDSDHHYTPLMARKAAQFFSKHLLHREYLPCDFQKLRAKEAGELQCTVSGQVRADFPQAKFLYEENQDVLAALENARSQISEQQRREQAVSFIRGQVFQHREHEKLWIKRLHLPAYFEGLCGDSLLWYSQKGVLNHAFLFRPAEHLEEKLPVTIALWENGTSDLQRHRGVIYRLCARKRAVLVLDLCGMGHMRQRPLNSTGETDFYGVNFKLNDDLVWMDDCMAALRTYELLRCLDMVSACRWVAERDTQIYTVGNYSCYADFAMLLDGRLRAAEESEPMESYRSIVASRYYDSADIASFVFTGLLQYTDLDEIRRWNQQER